MSNSLMTLSPSMWIIAAAFALLVLPRMGRNIVSLTIPLIALYTLWQLGEGDSCSIAMMGMRAELCHLHPFSRIFATVFCLVLWVGSLFALPRDDKTELAAAFLYAGSAIGVTTSGDLIGLFIYWELMAVGSTIVILRGNTQNTKAAALRYALMHGLGGVFLLAGITAYMTATGQTAFTPTTVEWGDLLQLFSSPTLVPLDVIGTILILLGVLVNAAAPPFSAWLADAYPESSPVGAVFLSAFTTKTAVFVLLTFFAGTKLLIGIGLFMVFYGIILAILENNIRRILAYSIVNQVGFMVVGVGIGTPLALAGVAAHAFCHIIYKALLLMSAGAVLHQTGKHKCTEVGGLYHSMKLTAFCGIVGALAISAFPITSGFVSKSMISSAAEYEHLAFVWYALVAASAGVFLHAGIKFPWFVFFQKDSGLRPKDPPWPMSLAMVLLVVLCIAPGIYPTPLYQLLPVVPDYQPNTATHIITQLQLLLFSGLAFFVMLPWLKRTLTISLDFDWFYRVLGNHIIRLIGVLLIYLRTHYHAYSNACFAYITPRFQAVFGAQGAFAKSWGTGVTTLMMLVLLGGCLLVYYVFYT